MDSRAEQHGGGAELYDGGVGCSGAGGEHGRDWGDGDPGHGSDRVGDDGSGGELSDSDELRQRECGGAELYASGGSDGGGWKWVRIWHHCLGDERRAVHDRNALSCVRDGVLPRECGNRCEQ